jgi:hypothetical protein
MAQVGKDASPVGGAIRYARHRPETILLYQLVNEYYPAFADQMAARDTPLPAYIQCEFEDYLKCGRLEHGFLRVRCESCHTEHLVAFSCTNSRRFGRAQGVLPQLRGQAHGRKRCTAGR